MMELRRVKYKGISEPMVMLLLWCLLHTMSGSVCLTYAQTAEKHNAPEQQEDLSKKPILKALSMGAAKAGDGTPLDVRTYENQEGIKLTTAHGRFTSSEDSNTELQRQVRSASRVIEREPRRLLGLVVGERAVVILQPIKENPPRAAILLTDGADYYEITSSSLKLVLEVEKWYYRLDVPPKRTD